MQNLSTLDSVKGTRSARGLYQLTYDEGVGAAGRPCICVRSITILSSWALV